jgi:rhodanese-related sulfurtransferase
MRNRLGAILLMVAVAFLAVVCEREPAPRIVSPTEARALVEWPPGVLVVDVRTPEEYAEGHLPGAHRVQLDELAAAIDGGEFPGSPEAPVLVYCRTGSRSAQAATLLAGRGFERVYDLEGGITAWGAEGQPVQR